MLVRRSKTELDHGGADLLQREICRDGFHEPTFVAASRKPKQGGIAMALEANGKWFCKVVHTENGRTWTRRIHILMVQSSDGKLHYLQGKDLPDSISLYSGVPYSGAHLAEVLLSPKDAKTTPLLPAASGWIGKRDVFYMALGFFFLRLIQYLAEEVALALT